MGGIALGKGVERSGLLDVLGVIIRNLVHGYRLYTVVLILSPVVLVSISIHKSLYIQLHYLPKVTSTFISHTIASVLLVPIAKEVGESLRGHHADVLIFITALICSAGMGMPVSGFPNQTACVFPSLMLLLFHRHVPYGNQRATQEDELGELYLTNIDFLKNGVPSSIIATLVG